MGSMPHQARDEAFSIRQVTFFYFPTCMIFDSEHMRILSPEQWLSLGLGD